MNRGDRGITGERGPKGDHGQPGDTGGVGAPGPRGRAYIALFLITVAYVTAGWWLSERHSCNRQEGVRASSLLVAETARDARRKDAEEAERKGDLESADYFHRLADNYAEAARRSQPLDCDGLTPDWR